MKLVEIQMSLQSANSVAWVHLAEFVAKRVDELSANLIERAKRYCALLLLILFE
jgi:hypothetical protein